MKEINIYLLELEGQKYYLTYSIAKNSQEVLEKHLDSSNTIKWTSKYKALSVLKSFKGTMDDLRDYSIWCLNNFGVSKIRGTFIDQNGIKGCSKLSIKKPIIKPESDLIDDPLLDILDDPLDIRVLKMGSESSKKFYVVNSLDPQDFYFKMSNGFLPDGIIDVPIAISGTVRSSKDLFNKLVSKYGVNCIGFWKS